MTELRTPTSTQGCDAVRTVLREYAEQLGVDLSFQDFKTELLRLPGPCEAPRGALLTMHVAGHGLDAARYGRRTPPTTPMPVK